MVQESITLDAYGREKKSTTIRIRIYKLHLSHINILVFSQQTSYKIII